MDQMPIDENQRRSVIKLADDMVIPDLGVKGARCGACHLSRLAVKHDGNPAPAAIVRIARKRRDAVP
jgi:hypothetical protein